MFLAELLTVLEQGLKKTFTDIYPVHDFRGVHVSLDYPVEEINYPGIWVGFDFTADIGSVGINHKEFIEEIINEQVRFGEVARWRFEGEATFTLAALSSLTRARLLDEVIKTIGFGRLTIDLNPFHKWIDENPLIGVNLNHERLSIRGLTESSPTPWDTDDLIYEVTVAAPCVGEFVSTPSGVLVPLSEVRIYPYAEGTPDPTTPGGWA
jgi:hypothetical protein